MTDLRTRLHDADLAFRITQSKDASLWGEALAAIDHAALCVRTIVQLHTADDGGCEVCETIVECVTRAEATAALTLLDPACIARSEAKDGR